MRAIGPLIASAAICLSAAYAQAQPAANSTTSPATTGGMMGAGGGMGPHMGGRMRAGPHDTMGWSMMTAQERREHRTKMMSFTSRKECLAYIEQHHRLMVERAKKRGVAIPPSPRRDACAGLKD